MARSGLPSGALCARAAELARFYGRPEAPALPPSAASAPVVAWAIGDDTARDLLTWGQPFGAVGPADAGVVVAAEDRQLRDLLSGWGLAFARTHAAARLVTAPCGPVAGYRAEGPDCTVWASHAVAAAWLARGAVSIDPDRIPELLAYDFVGGGASLISGVRGIGPATVIDLATPEAERSYWPQAERWSPVPAESADEHITRALLAGLAARVDRRAPAALGLTGGADSRVLALALREIGADTRAFTWGEEGWRDVEGARAIAAALDIPWTGGAAWRTDADMLECLDGETRWADGSIGIAPSSRVWPGGTGCVVIGAAGEVGRAFYYRRHARGTPPESADALVEALHPAGRLPHAAPAAQARVRTAVESWATAALASGRSGWDALDVLYAEQRVAHWLRTQTPPLERDLVLGFASVEAMRGLSSLAPGDKLTDGFHRRFVAARRADLALPAVPPPPRPARRVRRALGRVRRRLRPAPPAAPSANPLLTGLWAERPQTRAWVLEALGHGLLRDTLGDVWVARTREGFARGHDRTHEQACLACGPVMLHAALGELRSDRRAAPEP